MKITKSEFVTSLKKFDAKFNTILKEVVFVGRSNVGKSSLINAICNKKNLAKTSSTPGRTRLINYFKINDNFFIVDLPGYGFASGNQKEVDDWGKNLEDFFENNKLISLVLVLLDIRHLPSKKDEQMLSYLRSNNIEFEIVLTKADKLSKSQIIKSINDICSYLQIDKSLVTTTSSEKKSNINILINKIENYIS